MRTRQSLCLYLLAATVIVFSESLPSWAADVSATSTPSAVKQSGADNGKGNLPNELSTGDLYEHIAHNLYSSNIVWVLVAGSLVMFMQAGFAMIETGLCRVKNAAHTISMNFMIYALACIAFWAYVFAFVTAYARFKFSNLITPIRVSAEIEIQGLDGPEMGAMSYPDFSNAGNGP